MKRSVLDRLARPDTHDEAKQFSDVELKNALDTAARELIARGWEVRIRCDGKLLISKTATL